MSAPHGTFLHQKREVTPKPGRFWSWSTLSSFVWEVEHYGGGKLSSLGGGEVEHFGGGSSVVWGAGKLSTLGGEAQ